MMPSDTMTVLGLSQGNFSNITCILQYSLVLYALSTLPYVLSIENCNNNSSYGRRFTHVILCCRIIMETTFSIPTPKTPTHQISRDDRLRAQTLYYDAGWDVDDILYFN